VFEGWEQGLDPEVFPTVSLECDTFGQELRSGSDSLVSALAWVGNDVSSIIKSCEGLDIIDPGSRNRHAHKASCSLQTVPVHHVAIGEMDEAGYEVPQRICDGASTIDLQTLNNMGVMAENRRRTGVNPVVGKLDLLWRRKAKPLLAPVWTDNDVVILGCQDGDLFGNVGLLDVSDPRAGFGGKARGPATAISTSDECDGEPVAVKNCGSGGLRQVAAGPKPSHAKTVKQASDLAKSCLEAVEHVVVGQAQNMKTGIGHSADQFLIGDDTRLCLDGFALAGQRAFQVAHKHISTCPEMAKVSEYGLRVSFLAR
jgi:hypothetical protein